MMYGVSTSGLDVFPFKPPVRRSVVSLHFRCLLMPNGSCASIHGVLARWLDVSARHVEVPCSGTGQTENGLVCLVSHGQSTPYYLYVVSYLSLGLAFCLASPPAFC
jgi:hypothetical protein